MDRFCNSTQEDRLIENSLTSKAKPSSSIRNLRLILFQILKKEFGP